MDIDAPLILAGRGGSGTRLMSRLADPERFFIGNYINRTGDSLEWVETIYALARARLGGPEVDAPLARLRRTAETILADRISIGETVWGWKLPETILILPWVLEAFPRARVVFMVRHPIPTATGKPHITAMPWHEVGRAVLDRAYGELNLTLADARQDEAYRREAISWNFQIARALPRLAPLAAEGRLHLLRYETMCANPCEAAAQLDRFAGLEPNGRAGPAIEPDRMRGVDPSDPRNQAIWPLVARTAAALGYGPDQVDPVGPAWFEADPGRAARP